MIEFVVTILATIEAVVEVMFAEEDLILLLVLNVVDVFGVAVGADCILDDEVAGGSTGGVGVGVGFVSGSGFLMVSLV